MRQKSGPVKEPATQVLKNIRRATRRHFSPEDKICIVLEGLRGEASIAELCRREGIVQNLYYRWSKEFLEAGKKRLAGDTARAATSDEVKDLRREAGALKEVVAELTLENRLLKKSVTVDGEDRMRYPASEKLEIIGLVEQSSLPVRRTLEKLCTPPSTAGTIATRPVDRKLWTTGSLARIASGTAFPTMSASASSTWRWTSPRCQRGNWRCASPTPRAILSRRHRSIGCSKP
jgi:transposase-like protein